MKIIEAIDIFSTKFNFTVKKKIRFKTFFGGILSILCLGICIVLCFLFGRDFLYRSNPKILNQLVQPPKMDKPLKLKNSKLIIPWRIEDINGLPVANFSSLIFPTLYEYRYQLNITSGFFDNIKESIVPMSKCNLETANVPEFYENYDITDWYCPDWLTKDDYLFGGLWDDNFVYYYEFKIGYCPNATAFSAKNNCTTLEDLNKIFLSDNPYYISILYPRYSVDPNSIDNPVTIAFMNYFYNLSTDLRKTDRLFIKRADMSDDKGWIFTDIVKYSIMAYSRFASDFSLFDTKYYDKPGVSSSVYNLNIYCERDYDVVYRSYMKFQNLCADVGGLLKLLLIVFNQIAYFYNINSRKNIIFNEIFDLFSYGEREVKVNTNTNTNAGLKKKLFLERQINESSNFFREEFARKDRKKSILNLNFNTKERHNSPYINELTHSKQPLNSSNVFSKHISINMQLEDFKKKERQNKNLEKLSFNFFFKIKAYFCSRLVGKKEKFKAKVLFKIDEYLNKRLDVVFYLQNLVKFEKIIGMHLNKIQNMSMDYIKKENAFDLVQHKDEIDSLKRIKTIELKNPIVSGVDESKKNKIVNYFSEKLKDNLLTEVDKHILSFIDDSLKYKINQRACELKELERLNLKKH